MPRQEVAERMERTNRLRLFAVAYEVLLIVSMALVLLYKFYAFDAVMLPRHHASALILAGGLCALLCALSPLLLLPRRWRFGMALLIDFALSLLLFVDIIYMRYHGDLPALRNAVFLPNIGAVTGSVAALAKAGDARFFADIPLFALLMLLLPLAERIERTSFAGVAPRKRKRALPASACSALLLFVAGLLLVHCGLSSYEARVGGAMRAMWDRHAVATDIGSLLYHVADGSNLVRDAISRRHYSAAELNSLKGWLDEREELRGRPPSFGIARGRNLILIQVESLQSFAMKLAIGGTEVTPCLNALARQSLFFPAVYVQTASGNSSDAELLSNASLFPSAGGVAFARFADGRFETLASHLKKRGYRTIAYHGDRPSFWNRDRMYPALGFDRYVSRDDYHFSEAIGLGLSDAAFFQQTLGSLKELDAKEAPFYAFLVTLSSHHPYGFDEIRAQVQDLPLGALDGTLLGNYLLAIRYADRELGKFLAGLERSGLLDRNVIAVYGDHAAIQQGESERLSALLNLDLSTDAAWRALNCVPLIVRLPHAALRGEARKTAGQIDIAPTLASLMGFDLRTAMGEDLTAENPAEGVAVFRNGNFVTDGVYVLPAERRAFALAASTEIPYTEALEKKAADARRRLMLSDMVLETSGRGDRAWLDRQNE